MKSLHNKKFSHRCEGDRFISSIPPQTIQDEGKKQHAHSIVVKIKCDFFSMVDVALWETWSEIEAFVQLLGEDVADVFFF